MDADLKQLVSKLVSAEIKRAPELDDTICKGEKVIAYKVETNKLLCKVWNASNNHGFDKKEICNEIAQGLLSDESICEGNISHNFNEIMYEITEK